MSCSVELSMKKVILTFGPGYFLKLGVRDDPLSLGHRREKIPTRSYPNQPAELQ